MLQHATAWPVQLRHWRSLRVKAEPVILVGPQDIMRIQKQQLPMLRRSFPPGLADTNSVKVPTACDFACTIAGRSTSQGPSFCGRPCCEEVPLQKIGLQSQERSLNGRRNQIHMYPCVFIIFLILSLYNIYINIY